LLSSSAINRKAEKRITGAFDRLVYRSGNHN
jgi:hypothetical protein